MSIVDDVNESTPGDVAQLKKDLAEATSVAKAADKVEAPAEDELPEKYRGKSVKDVIEMHRNAESELGRKANELGQYKSLTDRLLELKRREDLTKGGASEDEIEEAPLPKVSSSDLLEDPTGTIAKLLEARDKSNDVRNQRREQERLLLEQQEAFAQAHPDADEIVKNQEFLDWVGKSTARSLLGYQASNGDMVAGSALLDEWKATRSEAPAEDKEEATDTISQARRASTESAGQSRTPDAPTGKTYRRLDLIRLKLEDPEAYADENFQREIIKAYAEGRVK